jgi:hypothetical protein
MNEAVVARAGGFPVAEYKRILQRVLENRPSGTRQRLATALGTNRSFVSQIANPAYTMPIPMQHLDSIFEVCHFSGADRRDFREAYVRAHPERQEGGDAVVKTRVISVAVADLGDVQRNRALDEMVARFARQISRFAEGFRGME